MADVVFALDVGSSSLRCSAYRIDSHGVVEPLEGCMGVRKIRAVQPNTGKILLETSQGKCIFDEIDGAIDDALEGIRRLDGEYRVVGLGFSTFVMNFLAVDANGMPVGGEATISYACNTPEVSRECEALRR